MRYPAPLQPGDRIGVTSPSNGVSTELWPRFEFCVGHLRQRGYEVVVGDCMDGSGVVSAPALARAQELMAMLTDPGIRAVVPPWGGELAVDLLPHLDFAALGAADLPWLVGYSDISTLLLPLTTLTGVATLHGQNLMDTPYRVPAPLLSWLDVASRPAGSYVEQGASARHKDHAFDPWQDDPTISEMTLELAGQWSVLEPGPVHFETVQHARGRLIGGCIETLAHLAGTPYGDVRAFAQRHAPEGLIVYLEASEWGALDVARALWGLRLAGWFDHANAVLIGRTRAPSAKDFSQADAVRYALGDLGIPIVLDVDCGHVSPHLALVNGALAEITVDGANQRIVQTLA